VSGEQPGADRSQAPAPGPGDPCGADRLRDAEAWLIAETSQGRQEAYECGWCGGWHVRDRPPEWPPMSPAAEPDPPAGP